MKLLYILTLVTGLVLCCGIAGAMTLGSGITVNTTNASTNFSQNLTYDNVVIGPHEIDFNSGDYWSNLTIYPSAPINVNVSKYNVSGDYSKSWVVTASQGTVIRYLITGNPVYSIMGVNLNGTLYSQLTSDTSGSVSFSHVGNSSQSINITMLDDGAAQRLKAKQKANIDNSATSTTTEFVLLVGLIITIILLGAIIAVFKARQ